VTAPRSRYRLLKADGTDLGLLVGAEPHWRPGDTLYRGAAALEVLRVVDAEPGERLRAYVVVADAAPAQASLAAR
jgi:hypothetical protein